MRTDVRALLVASTIAVMCSPASSIHPQATAPVRAVTLTESRRYAGEFDFIGGIAASGTSTTVLVSQPNERTFVRLSANASEARTVGRRGEGPGEFSSTGSYGSTGRAFWVYDRALMRLTLLDFDGQLLRTTPWQPRLNGVGDVRAPSLLGFDGSKSFMVTGMRPGGLGVGIGIGERLFFFSSDSGATWRIMGQATGPETCAVQTPQVSVPIPNCSMPTYKASSDAKALVVVQPSADDPKVVTVTAARTTGPQGYSIRLAFRPQPIPRSTQDSVRRYLEGRKLPARLPPLPRSYPVVGRVLVDETGNAYLEELVAGRPGSWLMLDATGRPVERLLLPDDARLHAVSAGHFWASTTNEVGEPEVTLLRRKP